MKMTISKKLSVGMAIMGLLIVGNIAVTRMQLRSLALQEDRLTEQYHPIAAASQSLLTQVVSSLATLRGYIILGADPDKARQLAAERRDSWVEMLKIEKELASNIKTADRSDFEQLLAGISSDLVNLRRIQDQVETVAHAPENQPALQMLLGEAAPRAAQVNAAATGLIDLEQEQPAGVERKNLLKHLADFRGSYALGLAELRMFVLTGDARFRAGFEERWQANQKAYGAVAAAESLFNAAQSEQWNVLKRVRGEFAPMPGQIIQLRDSPDWNRAVGLLGTQAAPLAASILKRSRQMISLVAAAVDQSRRQLQSTQDTMLWVMLIAGASTLVLGGLALALAGRSVVKPVKLMIDRLRDIAQGEGDLTRRLEITTTDEVGELGGHFNAFVAKIQDLITQVAGVSREVASASAQIAASAEEMAGGMGEQSKQVQQISASVEEMSSSVVEVAKKSQDAAGHANSSGQAAQEGGRAMDLSVQSMRAIEKAVNESAGGIEELGKKGQEIGRVIEVINDIADQTNLLALNAAIEAARAGEHGRGFAVVADEVRKLADRTTKATEEIGNSIKTIQNQTARSVQRMSAGTDQVADGLTKVQHAGTHLQTIVQAAGKVAQMVDSIAAATQQQSAASEQVARSVESISAVTRQASESAGQSAQAAAQLSTKAEQLQTLVGRFKV